MGLRVRFQGGAYAGAVREFGDDRETVRFGRKAAVCDVVFPPSELRVSREHFALKRVLGSYRLVTNHKSPVLVDGAPGHDDQILETPCELQVGIDGPKVVLESDGDAAFAATVGLEVYEPEVHSRVEGLTSSVERNRLATILALALIAVAIVAGWLAVSLVRERADRGTTLARKALERSEAVRLETIENIERSKLDFARVFESARRSVYLVAERIRKGSSEVVMPLATAWVAGDGIVATNAHVAEGFDPTSLGGSLFLRSCADPPVDVRVRSARLHPGYAVFSAIVNGTDGHPRAFDAGAAEFLAMLPACDVALLEVDTEERAKLGPPLAIAPDAVLRTLAHGEPLGFIGFPSEGLIRGGTDADRPQPTAQTGSVTAVTDFFLSRSVPEAAQLVQFSMSAAGGASGSPVLNRAGQVVAVLSGGNSVTLGGGIPRLPVGGVNYGQRADLLRELLDGGDEALSAIHDRRSADWRRQHAAIFAKGADGLFVYLIRDVERRLAQRTGQSLELVEYLTKDESLGGTVREVEFRFPVPTDGVYLAIAVASAPIDVDASIGVEGTVRGLNAEPDYFPTVEMIATRGETAVYRLWTSATDAPAGTPVRIRIYQVAGA